MRQHISIFIFMAFLNTGSVTSAEVLRSVSIKNTVDNMLNQILSPIPKKLRELQQTYTFRSLNFGPDSSGMIYGTMSFFGGGASVCNKNENHNIISEIKYEFKKSQAGWTEEVKYSGCDNSVASLTEKIEVSVASDVADVELPSSRMSQADILSGKRILRLQKNEINRRYTIYNYLNHPILSIVSNRSSEGAEIEIWVGSALMISAHVKESNSKETFIYRRHGIDTKVDFGFGDWPYRDPAEENLLSQQLIQGTAYTNQLTGENLTYAQMTQKLDQHLIDVVASQLYRSGFEQLLSNFFPTGATVAQPSCLRNELLRLEAQLRSGSTNNSTIQDLLNTYIPLWRKALDSGDLNDSRSLPCK